MKKQATTKEHRTATITAKVRPSDKAAFLARCEQSRIAQSHVLEQAMLAFINQGKTPR